MITDPEVIQDMERYVRLTKEYKELETITRTADKFKAALLSVEESKDILLHEEDKELREMAEMEIEELEDKLPGMEQELKLLLVPADPDDSKNVILEIRGGTGGDEACLFAGDLFRMYAKFCERKGWKVEVTNANEGTAGGSLDSLEYPYHYFRADHLYRQKAGLRKLLFKTMVSCL